MRSDIVGFLTEREGEWLFEQAADSEVIVEVGCYKGRSTDYLCRGLGNRGVVFTIDNFIGSKFANQQHHFEPAELNCLDFQQNMKHWLKMGRVFLIEEDTKDAYDILRRLLKHRKADMIFIDGEHDETSVRFDIMACKELLAPHGMLCGHDYSLNYPGVMQAVRALCPVWKRGADSIWHIPRKD